MRWMRFSRPLATLLATFALLHGSARAEALVFAVNQWCPYICDLSSARPGMLIEIVREIFTDQGIDISFVNTPLSRGVELARGGKVQGIVGIIPAVAPDLLFPAEALIDTQFCFFTKPDSTWRFMGFDQQYEALSLGLAYGKAIDPRLGHAFPRVARISGDAVIGRMLAMLQLQRLDSVLEDQRSVLYAIETKKLPPFRNAGCVEKKSEYVAFYPANPRAADYAQMFSKGMAKLRESGRLARIIATYTDGK